MRRMGAIELTNTNKRLFAEALKRVPSGNLNELTFVVSELLAERYSSDEELEYQLDHMQLRTTGEIQEKLKLFLRSVQTTQQMQVRYVHWACVFFILW